MKYVTAPSAVSGKGIDPERACEAMLTTERGSAPACRLQSSGVLEPSGVSSKIASHAALLMSKPPRAGLDHSSTSEPCFASPPLP